MTLKDRFLDKVSPEPNTGCWLWTAGTKGSDFSYGHFHVNGKSVSAHRFSWELHNGPIPKGEGYHGVCVCHRCDNGLCVNPDHLFLSDHVGNMADRDAKQRGHMGETHRNAKLTTKDVIEIRDLLKSKQRSEREIARLYGVSRRAIRQVGNRKTWDHVA